MKIYEREYIQKYNIDITAIIGAIIISMNGIRYLIGIQESNVAIYGMYGLFILCGTFQFAIKKGTIYPKDIGVLLILTSLLLIFAMGTSLIWGSISIAYGVKLMISFFTAFIFYLMPASKYRIVINYFSIIMLVYIISIIARPNNVNTYLSRGSNYLVLTLPIGLYLTMRLSKVILKLYDTKKDKSIFVDVVLCVISFISLTKFAGRGSILFPVLVSLILIMVLGRKHLIKFLLITILMIISLYFAYDFFIKYANPYIVSRMQNLINNNDSEDRWLIWSNYLEMIKINKWFIIGGGTGASVLMLGYYPHNIFLQLVGEYGLIGLIEGIYVTFLVLKKQIFVFLKLENDSRFILFIELSSGLMYLFFTFMKSFSIFDASILFIFIFMIISLVDQMKEEVLNG